MSARAASPFSPRVVLSMVLFGALAFLATLYLIGAGGIGRDENDGGGHAAGRGLNGYAALARMLDERGLEVSSSRRAGRMDDEALLVLTPPMSADADELNRILERRHHRGPTLVILPKWYVQKVPSRLDVKSQKGWVQILGAGQPDWASDLGRKGMIKFESGAEESDSSRWEGLGRTGALPDPQHLLTMASDELVPLVRNGEGKALASFWNDGGYYPELAAWAGVAPFDGDDADTAAWPVVIVAEPDLMNNYGMADRNRAMLALTIVDATLEGSELPVVFDLTLNGLGNSANLLTLAFSPPFLAATLCLVIAALVIGWRAFRRFGPPLAETPVFAFGKRQLATNGAALIQRSRRLHLLGAPYAALVRERAARLIGLRQTSNAARTDAEIDRVLAARGIDAPRFTESAEAMRRARSPNELLRAAHALKQIERILAS
jgi:hypothetical protein